MMGTKGTCFDVRAVAGTSHFSPAARSSRSMTRLSPSRARPINSGRRSVARAPASRFTEGLFSQRARPADCLTPLTAPSSIGLSLYQSWLPLTKVNNRRTQMSFNKITLVGNLGRDPELRYTPQGTPVCSFSLATNERRKDRNTGENNDITTWFRVTLWGRQAETASQYLTRGRPVYIEGRLRVEEWTDRDGKPRHTLEVHATDMQFIGGGRSDEGTAPASRAAAAAPEPAVNAPDMNDDDVPF